LGASYQERGSGDGIVEGAFQPYKLIGRRFPFPFILEDSLQPPFARESFQQAS
jgi:hypothetical protein